MAKTTHNFNFKKVKAAKLRAKGERDKGDDVLNTWKKKGARMNTMTGPSPSNSKMSGTLLPRDKTNQYEHFLIEGELPPFRKAKPTNRNIAMQTSDVDQDSTSNLVSSIPVDANSLAVKSPFKFGQNIQS